MTISDHIDVETIHTGTAIAWRVEVTEQDPAYPDDPDQRIAVDITGWTIGLYLKRMRNDTTAEVTATGVLTDPANGIADITVTPSQTESVKPGKLFRWVLGTDDTGNSYVLIDDRVQLAHGPVIP
jgi:hypothetical protein